MQLHKGERFLDPRLLKGSGLSLGSGGAGSNASWQSSPPRRQRRASLYGPSTANDIFRAGGSGASSPPSLLSSLGQGDFARQSMVLRPGTAGSRPATSRRNSVDSVVSGVALAVTTLRPERPLVLALAGMAEHAAAQRSAQGSDLHEQSLAVLLRICQGLLAKPFFPATQSVGSHGAGDEPVHNPQQPHQAHWPSPAQPLLGCGVGNAGTCFADCHDGMWLCQHPAVNLFEPRSGIWAAAADESPAHIARAAPYTLPSRLQTDMTLAHMLLSAWALHMRSGCADAQIACECCWALVPTEQLQSLVHRDARYAPHDADTWLLDATSACAIHCGSIV